MYPPPPPPPPTPKLSLTPEEQKRIVAALEACGAKAPCPRCGNPSFSLLDGYFSHSLQGNLSGISFGGPAIPVAVVACQRCGFLAEHALGALGLLPKGVAK
jgi:hypothetical protein